MLAVVHYYFYYHLWKSPRGWPPYPAHHFLSPFIPFLTAVSKEKYPRPQASALHSVPLPPPKLAWMWAHVAPRQPTPLCSPFQAVHSQCPPRLSSPHHLPRPPARVGARVPAACQTHTCGWGAPAAVAESGEHVSPPPDSLIHCNLAASLCHPSLLEPGS